VKRSRRDHEIGILRIDFPGFTGTQSLEQISWEEFFENFDRQKLAFLYQETTARGLRSNFNRLIKRRPEGSPVAVEQPEPEERSGASEPVRAKTTAAKRDAPRGRTSRSGRNTRTR
jgi:hypothetical protein